MKKQIRKLVEYALSHGVEYEYILEDILKILDGKEVDIEYRIKSGAYLDY